MSEMEIALTEQVRTACNAVADLSTHVHINYDHLASYASLLPIEREQYPELDPQSHYLNRGDDTAAFFLILDTINFGSGYFPLLSKRPGMSGYFTVAHSLNDFYKNRGPLTAEDLTHLTIEDCTGIFAQDPANKAVAELMQLFTTALNDLGHYLLESFDGSYIALIEAAGSSAERLVQLLMKMPFFNDVALYDNLKVPFYKRAQLMAADLSIAFQGEGLGTFNDLYTLTIFADNLVPHVLRVDNVLFYEEVLSARIDAGELIPFGSAEEIEIRACAVHAVELLKEELNRIGYDVKSLELDYMLWNRGQQPYYKARPRHRTRTVFY
jgi:hypothetical protein